MSGTEPQRVSCPGCGKGYRWDIGLVGRTVACRKCGVSFAVPGEPGGVGDRLGAAVSEDGTYELDLDEQTRHPDEPEPIAVPSQDGKCPACNNKINETAVICLNCGFNLKQGKHMGRPDITELAPEERKAGQREAYAPIRGMALVRTGLWLNFLEILLAVAAIPIAVVAVFMALDAVLIIDILTYIALGCAALSSVLCLAAPKESNARPILIISIILVLIATGITMLVTWGKLEPIYDYLASVISIAGTACFLYFFVMLARYLEFPEIVERAEKVLGLYIMIQLGFYLMLLPFIGCVLTILVLGTAIYTLWLYVMLLIDLNNALSYRISEQKADVAG